MWVRGKRSICLNITKDAGLEAFYKLADSSDVVLTGFRKGVAERLGIGYEQLSERNPRIVYAAINAFGQEGPWAMRPGFDQNAQAATGMQIRNGGEGGEPGPPPYTFNDYGTGIMAAYGVILALLERERTGRGQKVDTSLAYTASTFSSEYMIDYEGFEPDEISGPGAKGSGPFSRLYRTSDGWLALSAESDDELQRLLQLEPFEEISEVDLSASMETVFASDSTSAWLELLSGAGVPATSHQTQSDVRSDTYVRDAGLILSEEHEAFGAIEHGGTAQQMSKTPARVGTSPVFGGDTVSILGELGYTREEIDSMRAEGVIPRSEGLPLS